MGGVADIRSCEQCGTSFAPRREHARFCSARCRVTWNRHHASDSPADSGPLDWSITAMRESTDRLLRSGGLELDVAARRARRDGAGLVLTVREFDLLAFFMSHPGQAFNRAELMERVWGWTFGDQSTVTVHVRRLRGKVEEEPGAPVLLRTVRGVGYCWDPEPWPAGGGADISNP